MTKALDINHIFVALVKNWGFDLASSNTIRPSVVTPVDEALGPVREDLRCTVCCKLAWFQGDW